ncbi:MAG: hypothetical protein C0598_08750 [Marinilabiliales bacterium]|nr:MAG: hypothetical protein C0598_08750 [Marinilabiliales bacterium]
MKTLTKSTIAVLMTIFLTTNIFAGGLEMENEEYINDIPFNTEKIAGQMILENALSTEFSIEEENVNDIPFDTYEIAAGKMQEIAMNKDFELQDESYINDIPFNTNLIANQSADSTNFIVNK